MCKVWPQPEDYREVQTMEPPLTRGHMVCVKGCVAKVVQDGFVMTAAGDTDILFLFGTDRRRLADSTIKVNLVGVVSSEAVAPGLHTDRLALFALRAMPADPHKMQRLQAILRRSFIHDRIDPSSAPRHAPLIEDIVHDDQYLADIVMHPPPIHIHITTFLKDAASKTQINLVRGVAEVIPKLHCLALFLHMPQLAPFDIDFLMAFFAWSQYVFPVGVDLGLYDPADHSFIYTWRTETSVQLILTARFIISKYSDAVSAAFIDDPRAQQLGLMLVRAWASWLDDDCVGPDSPVSHPIVAALRPEYARVFAGTMPYFYMRCTLPVVRSTIHSLLETTFPNSTNALINRTNALLATCERSLRLLANHSPTVECYLMLCTLPHIVPVQYRQPGIELPLALMKACVSSVKRILVEIKTPRSAFDRYVPEHVWMPLLLFCSVSDTNVINALQCGLFNVMVRLRKLGRPIFGLVAAHRGAQRVARLQLNHLALPLYKVALLGPGGRHTHIERLTAITICRRHLLLQEASKVRASFPTCSIVHCPRNGRTSLSRACRCGRFLYCSQVCQRIHWREEHRQHCPAPHEGLTSTRVVSHAVAEARLLMISLGIGPTYVSTTPLRFTLRLDHLDGVDPSWSTPPLDPADTMAGSHSSVVVDVQYLTDQHSAPVGATQSELRTVRVHVHPASCVGYGARYQSLTCTYQASEGSPPLHEDAPGPPRTISRPLVPPATPTLSKIKASALRSDAGPPAKTSRRHRRLFTEAPSPFADGPALTTSDADAVKSRRRSDVGPFREDAGWAPPPLHKDTQPLFADGPALTTGDTAGVECQLASLDAGLPEDAAGGNAASPRRDTNPFAPPPRPVFTEGPTLNTSEAYVIKPYSFHGLVRTLREDAARSSPKAGGGLGAAFVNGLLSAKDAEIRNLKLRLKDLDHAKALAAQSATHSEQRMDQLRLQMADLALEVEKLQHDAQSSRASDEGNMYMLRMVADVWTFKKSAAMPLLRWRGPSERQSVQSRRLRRSQLHVQRLYPLWSPLLNALIMSPSRDASLAKPMGGEAALRTLANMSSVLQRIHELTAEEQLADDHDLADTSLGPPP
ncbi:hypothetical protein BD626DRAFT_572379 [Schizophyllum amplum]|uniref:MYND-type domain-containing protein n=1 Tax=Schizophyllum amplum TaxID=97359 RepID=A0A550C4G2_9AGAR|nr:hypothetical protein BD626DRAFT_572379 [Auriculariopsis ampla]